MPVLVEGRSQAGVRLLRNMGRLPANRGDDFLAHFYNERVRLLTKQINHGLTKDEFLRLSHIKNKIEEYELSEIELRLKSFEEKVQEYDQWADSVCAVLDKTIEYLCENSNKL